MEENQIIDFSLFLEELDLENKFKMDIDKQNK